MKDTGEIDPVAVLVQARLLPSEVHVTFGFGRFVGEGVSLLLDVEWESRSFRVQSQSCDSVLAQKTLG